MGHLIWCLQEAVSQLEQLVRLEKDCFGDISAEVDRIISRHFVISVTNRLVSHISC